MLRCNQKLESQNDLDCNWTLVPTVFAVLIGGVQGSPLTADDLTKQAKQIKGNLLPMPRPPHRLVALVFTLILALIMEI
jgi:hypothetical protein